jgi:hypothetical protein
MAQNYKPTSHAGALAGALLLALTAPDDERATKASQLASDIASMMDDHTQFNAVKDSVEACIAYFTGAPA